MPFENLTDDQKRILLCLIEALETGNYKNEAKWIATFEGKWLLLTGKDGHENEKICDVERIDLFALAEEQYITLIKPGITIILSLKQKAHREYKELKKGEQNMEQTSESSGNLEQQGDRQTVFVVHGRNEPLRRAMFDFLRSVELKPLEWSQALAETNKPTPYVGEVLDKAFSIARAVVVLMSPDDEARLLKPFRKPDDEHYESALTPQARPNVLFEAGMAMGRYADRTVLVEVGKLRPFSDIGGRHVVRLTNSTESRQGLAKRLETAGCKIDLSGTDWHRVGDFESDIQGAVAASTEVNSDCKETSAPLGSTATAKNRLLRLSIKQIVELLDGMSQQNKIAKSNEYVGQWLELELPVVRVKNGLQKSVVEFEHTVGFFLTEYSVIVIAEFAKAWKDRLQKVKRGDVLWFSGQIEHISVNDHGSEKKLHLIHAEFC